MSSSQTLPIPDPQASSSADPRASFRTKTVATRLSPDELNEIEAAGKRSGKTLAEWLRETALREARQRPADPMELILEEVAATRFMLLTLFHASALAVQEGVSLLPETVLKIRDSADARKHQTARKLLGDFLAGEAKNEGQNGAEK